MENGVINNLSVFCVSGIERYLDHLGSQKSLNFVLEKLKQYSAETYHHSYNVAKLCVTIGIANGMPADKCHSLFLAGLLHDVGKLRVPTSILHKSDRLTSEEYSTVKAHPIYGITVLPTNLHLSDVTDAILEHHEHMDGSGYPRGLSGSEISTVGRIVAIADVYEAMTADRAYHQAIGQDITIDYMKNNSGSFDKVFLNTFFSYISKNTLFV